MRALLQVTVVALVLGGLPGRAEPQKDDAAALLQRGIELYNRAKFKASQRLLERARGLARDQKLLGRVYLYLGLNQAVLGDTTRAKQSFGEALDRDPKLKLNSSEFKQDLCALLDSVRASRRGQLTITTDRVGASASVDGGEHRPLPCTVEVDPGDHTIEVRDQAGRVAATRQVTIDVRQTLSIEVSAALAPAAGPGPAPGGEAAGEGTVSPAARPRSPKRIWTWVVGSVGVALIATGIGVYASAAPLTEEPVDGKLCEQSDPRGGCTDLLDRIRARENAGYALIGVGAAALAGSVVLFFVEGRSRAAEGARALRLAPLAEGGLVIRGVF